MPTQQETVDRNFEAFQKQLPELLKTQRGKYALLRDAKIVEFFDSMRDALVYSRDNFSDGAYSVQRVTDTPEDLGYFSHALCQPAL